MASDPIESLFDVGDKICGVLNSDGQSDEIVGDLEGRAGSRCVGHCTGVLDQALNGPE